MGLEAALFQFAGASRLAVSETAQGMQGKAKLGEEAELTRSQ